jgi:vacuolar-type H+-ATPase subunit H
MENTISSDNPAAAVADNPVTEPAAAASGTVQQGGQVNGQTAPAPENLGGVDPNRLPPSLKKAYDDMLKDYREKTTSLAEKVKAETAKAIEAYKSKAEFYDQFTKHDELVKYYNDYAQRLQQKATQQQEQTGQVSNKVMQEIQQIKTELQAAKTLEYVNAFADAKNEKGELLHPDFGKLSGFKIGKHQQAGDYDLLRASVELAPGNTPQEKLENGYKAAKDTYDAIYEEGRKAGMGRLQAKIKNGSLPPSSSAATSTAPRRPKDAMEALQFARQGLDVARD